MNVDGIGSKFCCTWSGNEVERRLPLAMRKNENGFGIQHLGPHLHAPALFLRAMSLRDHNLFEHVETIWNAYPLWPLRTIQWIGVGSLAAKSKLLVLRAYFVELRLWTHRIGAGVVAWNILKLLISLEPPWCWSARATWRSSYSWPFRFILIIVFHFFPSYTVIAVMRCHLSMLCRTARAGEFPATEASFSLKIPITTFSELASMSDMRSS